MALRGVAFVRLVGREFVAGQIVGDPIGDGCIVVAVEARSVNLGDFLVGINVDQATVFVQIVVIVVGVTALRARDFLSAPDFFFFRLQRLAISDRDAVVVWVDLAERQETVPVAAILDEGRLK